MLAEALGIIQKNPANHIALHSALVAKYRPNCFGPKQAIFESPTNASIVMITGFLGSFDCDFRYVVRALSADCLK